MIFFGSDHRGYKLKELLKPFLKEQNQEFEDLGTNSEEPADYPIYAKKVADKVLKEHGLGILICGSGAGMTMAANKIKGIYAALVTSPEHAKIIKMHSDINVLVFASDFISGEVAKKALQTFLQTKFDQLDGHQRRIEQIKALEQA